MSSNYTSDTKFIKKFREKKKSRMSFPENDTRDSSKCTAIEIDTISCIREQMPYELTISDAVATYIADDVTHKIREILHNARTKIRHANRRTLLPKDLDAVMELSNIERIYGPVSSHWKFSDGRFSYDDPTVNLFDLAFQAKTFIQSGPAHLTFHSIPTNTSVEQQYYENICKSAFSDNKQLVKIALNSLKTSNKIGNLVDLFSSFCFLAFLVGKGHKSLILNMLNSLIHNPYISVIQPGNGLKLITAFLTTELFPATLSTNALNTTDKCIKNEYQDKVTEMILFLMARWKTLESVVLLTLEKYINLNILNVHCISMNIIRILCSVGIEITNVLFWNKLFVFQLESQLNEIYLDYIYSDKNIPKHELHSETDIHYELRHTLWYAAAYVFRSLSFSNEWSREMSMLLGDSCVPLYPHLKLVIKDYYVEQEYKPATKTKLKRLYRNETRNKLYIEEVFEDYGFFVRTQKPIYGIKLGTPIYAKLKNEFQKPKISHNYNNGSSEDINVKTRIIIKNKKTLPTLEELIEGEIPKKPIVKCECHNLFLVL